MGGWGCCGRRRIGRAARACLIWLFAWVCLRNLRFPLRSGRVRVCLLCRTLPALRGKGVRSSSPRLGRGRWGRSRRCSFLVLRLCGGTLPLRGGLPLVASVHGFLELFDDGFAVGGGSFSDLVWGRLWETGSVGFPRGGMKGIRFLALTPALSLRERELLMAAWRSSRCLLSEEWREDGTVSWKRRGFELSSRSSSSLISLAMAS